MLLDFPVLNYVLTLQAWATQTYSAQNSPREGWPLQEAEGEWGFSELPF